MLIKMAWRNIWRNKRRTYITMASIMFAVFFAAFMESIQIGAWDHMLSNVVNYYYGYAQVHQNGYWDEQSIDKAFPLNAKLETLPEEIPEIKGVVPRIESFALASHEQTTKGVLVVGVDPDVEDRMTNLSTRLSAGSFFEAGDQAVLVGEGVAEALNLNLGDTLVLISQGYHGTNAAGKYPIKGLLHFGSPELNKRMVYLPLKEAQWFYGAEQLITTVALRLDKKEDTPLAVEAVKTNLDMENYEVMDWKEMIPDLVEARELDRAGNLLVLYVLYLIIAFGILGTILMMTKEREYEFGILIAIGMQRLKLAASVWLEILFIGIMGALAGIIVSLPLVYYFHVNPIDLSVMGEDAVATYEKFGMEPILPAAFDLNIFLAQAWVIFLIVTVLAFYPLFKIRKLKPVEAMRN
jgi:ABC-type lipoprotein release transport system permease subunit